MKKIIYAVEAAGEINKALSVPYETLVDIFAQIPDRAPEIQQKEIQLEQTNKKLKCIAEFDAESHRIALGVIDALKQEVEELKQLNATYLKRIEVLEKAICTAGAETCTSCGAIIPEGRQVCKACENKAAEK